MFDRYAANSDELTSEAVSSHSLQAAEIAKKSQSSFPLSLALPSLSVVLRASAFLREEI